MTSISNSNKLDKSAEPYTVFLPFLENTNTGALKKMLSGYKLSGVDHALSSNTGSRNSFTELYSDLKTVGKVVLIGLGKQKGASGYAKAIGTKVAASINKGMGSSIALNPTLVIDNPTIEQLACGIYLGIQKTGLYKTGDSLKSANTKFHCLSIKKNLVNAFTRGIHKGETISSIINLVNAPSNHKTTEDLEKWLKKSSKKYGYNLKVLNKKELEKQGFHALLAVNRGSEIPAKCLIASYSPKTKKKLKKVTLVGKGVTFDTGGLSIKSSANMHYMKSDMGGAAAVMGTIELAARLELQVDLKVIVPTTDNSVDALSIKPGDIISSYSGKTIEVIDTDAEGRLILADALSYAVKNYKPDVLIDLATLTGSVVRALGTEAAGIMSHNDALVREIEAAGKTTGEKVWRLPLWEEYASHMESDFADIKNLSSKPLAGSITAGKFLEAFVEEHPAWAHLDIAGTAFGSYPTSKGYSATGYGIDLLINWLSSL